MSKKIETLITNLNISKENYYRNINDILSEISNLLENNNAYKVYAELFGENFDNITKLQINGNGVGENKRWVLYNYSKDNINDCIEFSTSDISKIEIKTSEIYLYSNF